MENKAEFESLKLLLMMHSHDIIIVTHSYSSPDYMTTHNIIRYMKYNCKYNAKQTIINSTENLLLTCIEAVLELITGVADRSDGTK